MKSNNYIFDAIVDDIHCIDDECIIFDIINNTDLPTKHCFINTELLKKKIIIINKGERLRISATMVPEKNYLAITDCKDLNSNILKKIRSIHIIKCKRKRNNKTSFNSRLRGIYLHNFSPIVASDNDGIKTIIFKGKEHKFEYINENGSIKIVSLSGTERDFGSLTNLKSCRSYFSGTRKKHVFARTRYAKIYKTFEEHENRKRIFDEHLALCRNKIGDAQVKGVCLDGLVSNLKKNDGEVEFDLYTSKAAYKCVLLSSVYSNKFNSINKERKHLVGGFLVDEIIYVILLHKATKDEENVKSLKKHLGLAYARRIKELERMFNSTMNYEEK